MDSDTTIQYLSDSTLEVESDASIMRQSLSIKAVIATHSSFASKHQQASSSSRAEPQPFVQIGEGLQGAIFEQAGNTSVIKKENPKNETRPTRLSREYGTHVQISAAFHHFGPLYSNQVFVPRPPLFKGSGSRDDAFWTASLGKLPAEYQVRTAVFGMDRVLPLPKVVRRALISYFYPRQEGQASVDGNVVERVLSQEANKHCLARVYLGRNSHQFKPGSFSLRNFPLCLDAMKRLELQVNDIASAMGTAYATMQWGAGYNGDDVEFVLGTLATTNTEAPTLQDRAVRLCLLDFGQCEVVDMRRGALDAYRTLYGALVTGENRWFIPHCHEDPELFKFFRAGYIKAGNVALEQKGWEGRFDMEAFMDGYEEYARDFLL